MNDGPAPLASPRWSAVTGVAVILVVCLAVYWVALGRGGFHASEGHRVIPAYEMLDHGHWLVPRMFDQPYLRKPPGMPWAVAAFSEVFGRSPFTARAVSAASSTLMALFAFMAARRWFAAGAASATAAGLAAGLAQALMPVLWESGRAAEIEALNHLATQIAALSLIHTILFARTRRVLWAIVSGLAIVAATAAKGPASAPVFIAVLAATCLATRSFRPLRGAAWISLALGAVGSGLLLWAIASAAAREPTDPVTQSPGEFLFEPGHLLGVLTLPFVAFAQSLPASMAVVFPWGTDARSERDAGLPERAWLVARTLAWAWLIAILIYMVVGVRNPRYVLPAAPLLAPLVGYVVAGLGAWLTPKRARVARAALLGRPWVWPIALLIAAGVYIGVFEASRRASSGEAVGREVAAEIAAWSRATGGGPVLVAADHLIEARPEVLLAVEREATRLGIELRVVWIPGLGVTGITNAITKNHESRAVLLLRTDDSSGEAETAHVRIMEGHGPRTFGVHKYLFGLYLPNP